jgi:rubrerythrin
VGIIESLVKLVDPAAAHAREEELKVTRETPKRENSVAPPELVCRVCGHRSTEGPFCPVCLAETMERVSTRP